MRSLSASALSKIATRAGTEPVVVIEVDWGDSPVLYADRDIGSVRGRILAISNLDNVVSVSDSNSSQEISVTLDDTDGSIKAIFDTRDIHKRPVRVYQWFEGLELSDRFLLFAGKLSSPILWNERDRTVSFTVVSQLEDKEIGFSAEEGQFRFIPKDLVGKPWPMIFGKVLDSPCLRFNKAVTGTTMCGVGIVSGADYHNAVPLRANDQSFQMNMFVQNMQVSFLWDAAYAYESAYSSTQNQEFQIRAAQLKEQANKVLIQIQNAINKKTREEQCARRQRAAEVDEQDLGCNPVRILGGEDFPQGKPIEINIGGGILVGHFEGDQFHISSRYHLENEVAAEEAYSNATLNQACASKEVPFTEFDFSMNVPPGFGVAYVEGDGLPQIVHDMVRWHGTAYGTAPPTSTSTATQVAQYFWADAGSRVVMHSDEPMVYIASIIPGTVLAVKAYKMLDGIRQLVNVPAELYTVETKNYGPVTAVQIVLKRPLSTITDQGWNDELYVTFESIVGPHTVDILNYLIETYTDLECGPSFDTVRPKLDPFPMNFPILERKNALEVLEEIAFQARCALWIGDGKVYLKYLPEEPEADETITLSDLDAGTGVEVGLTETEDLVTKLIARWWLSWADDPNTLILRHNVAKYGTQEEEYEFYCFNQPDIVLKVATFWLIRKANTWKRIRFTTFLNKLNLETFDCVSLQLGNYVASSNVKAIVREATYNSADNTISMECWVPVRAGEMEQYRFAWPSTVSADYTFPLPEEIAAGNAGGGGVGQEATGELPIGFTDLKDWGDGVVWVGGPNIVFGANADWGDRHPTDVGFAAQEVVLTNTYAELQVRPKPQVRLKLNYLDPIEPPPILPVPAGTFVIDIRNTRVVDSEKGGEARLDTFFRGINESEQLVVDTSALFGDDEHAEGARYYFRFDEESSQFVAGAAFLK